MALFIFYIMHLIKCHSAARMMRYWKHWELNDNIYIMVSIKWNWMNVFHLLFFFFFVLYCCLLCVHSFVQFVYSNEKLLRLSDINKWNIHSKSNAYSLTVVGLSLLINSIFSISKLELRIMRTETLKSTSIYFCWQIFGLFKQSKQSFEIQRIY